MASAKFRLRFSQRDIEYLLRISDKVYYVAPEELEGRFLTNESHCMLLEVVKVGRWLHLWAVTGVDVAYSTENDGNEAYLVGFWNVYSVFHLNGHSGVSLDVLGRAQSEKRRCLVMYA